MIFIDVSARMASASATFSNASSPAVRGQQTDVEKPPGTSVKQWHDHFKKQNPLSSVGGALMLASCFVLFTTVALTYRKKILPSIAQSKNPNQVAVVPLSPAHLAARPHRELPLASPSVGAAAAAAKAGHDAVLRIREDFEECVVENRAAIKSRLRRLGALDDIYEKCLTPVAKALLYLVGAAFARDFSFLPKPTTPISAANDSDAPSVISGEPVPANTKPQ
eukprot:GHVT01086711.1.p1 GENE.GHVT01086711.1~~GHVT01086711.1.p1  ORF type:complete len:222 (+),score=35.87 GHVT01086711.1:3-668(+)